MPTSTLFTPLILTHTLAALAALTLGALVFLRRKGTSVHRLLGRSWAVLMLVVIMTSFFIKTNGGYSWIHLLSIGSLAALVLAIQHARRHRLEAHRFTMLGLYIGGLVIAGIFTLLPSRILGGLLWHMLGVLS